jgi:hypothetical protein
MEVFKGRGRACELGEGVVVVGVTKVHLAVENADGFQLAIEIRLEKEISEPDAKRRIVSIFCFLALRSYYRSWDGAKCSMMVIIRLPEELLPRV